MYNRRSSKVPEVFPQQFLQGVSGHFQCVVVHVEYRTVEVMYKKGVIDVFYY